MKKLSFFHTPFSYFFCQSFIFAIQGGNKMKETNQENEKLLLSIKEASSLIGISERAMRDLSLELNIQVRIGRRVLIHKKKLEKWIDRQVQNR